MTKHFFCLTSDKQNRRSKTFPSSFRLLTAATFALVVAVFSNIVSAQSPELVVETPDQASKIKNGSFEQWKAGQPVGWQVEIGATNNGTTPESQLKNHENTLVLSGDSSTGAWRVVKQMIKLQPNQVYRLSCKAMASGVKRQSNQFDNCFVGVFVRQKNNQVIARQFITIPNQDWRDQQLLFRTPPNANSGDVTIFLSKTGLLNVDDISVSKLRSEDSFQILVDEMDRTYSFFDHKKINWGELAEQYRAKATKTNSPKEFADIVADLLAELEDIHTWAETPDGKQIAKYRSSYQANFDFESVLNQLENVEQIRGAGFVGTTKSGGYGYVNVQSLTNPQTIQRLRSKTSELFESRGMIVDLRRNVGGSEPLAAQIASMFTDQERVYAKSKFRRGAKHSDFSQPIPRKLTPPAAGQPHFTKPMVCLIGPGCVSSGEAMAMMMKCLPHVTLVGQSTRGASGNPGVIPLPNGVNIWYSRWMSLLPDGTPIESIGVQPTVKVEHQSPGDPTFLKALEILNDN